MSDKSTAPESGTSENSAPAEAPASSPTPNAALAEAKAKAAEVKNAVRAKHIKALAESMGQAPSPDSEPHADDKPAKPAKAKPAKGGKDADAKAKPAKPEADADAEDGEKEAKAEDTEKKPEKDEAAELRRDKRQFSAFRERETRRLKAQETTLAQREANVKQIEQRAQEEIAAFKADKIGWLKRHGVDFKATLLDLAKEDSEDPKDRLLREAREKAEAVERRMAEREAREAEERERAEKEAAERAASEKATQAQARLRAQLSTEWDAVRDGDEFPYLSTLYEPSDVAQLALDTLLQYYKRTGQELTAGQVFARIENALRAEDQAREKARLKAKGEAAGSTARLPDRVRSDKSETPEAPSNRPTHDVTNRTARVASNAEPSAGSTPKYDRAALIARARAAMQ